MPYPIQNHLHHTINHMLYICYIYFHFAPFSFVCLIYYFALLMISFRLAKNIIGTNCLFVEHLNYIANVVSSLYPYMYIVGHIYNDYIKLFTLLYIKSNSANIKYIHCSNQCHITCIKDKEHNMTGNFISDLCIGQELPFNCMIHDGEFMNAIIDYQQIPSKLMLEKLNELLFDPFEMDDDI